MPSREHDAVVDMLRALAAQAEGDPEPTMDDRRQGYELIAATFALSEDVEATPVDASGVPCDWVVAPGAEPDRVVQYLHGGGYGIGSPVTHRELAGRISRAAAARVLVVDYRLAPEHPFPAAVDDAVAVYRWLLSEGVHPSRIVVAGDSAGGGLTVATLVALRDAGEPLPAAGVCLSPWFDLEMAGESVRTKAGADPVVSAESLELYAHNYLAGQDPRHPLASPLHADLTGLPPLLVQVGTAEILLDDARRLTETACACGVSVELEEYDDLIHIFQQLAPTSPEAQSAVARIGEFVRSRVI